MKVAPVQRVEVPAGRVGTHPARLPLRTELALVAGRLCGAGSRRLSLGRGQVIGGRVAMAMDRQVLARLTAHRAVTLVSGTNGKTTTTLLIAAALRASRTVAATTGANMSAGHVVAAFAGADELVLEVDELYLPRTLEATRPAVLVLLNLSRDQLDRMIEVRRVAELWRAAIAGVSWEMTIVANADDPLVVWAVGGRADVVWVGGATAALDRAVVCPSCGHAALSTGVDHWSCACGAARPAVDWSTTAHGISGPGVSSPLQLALPGAANRSNAAMAIAAAAARGVDAPAAVCRVGQVPSVAGRYRTVPVAGRAVRLLLAKNPASWAEVLELIVGGTDPVVICVNARSADGHDTSWLWDVPFERLGGRTVVATGERRWDLAMRLETAGVACRVAVDPLAAVASVASPGSRVDLVSTYSAFHGVLRRLRVTW